MKAQESRPDLIRSHYRIWEAFGMIIDDSGKICAVTIDILTLFPEMFVGPLEWSIVKRAQDKHLMEIRMHDLRAWATDKYKSAEDRPYGGGAGMIMRVDVVDRAADEIKKSCTVCQLHSCTVVLLDAGGEKYSQAKAEVLAKSGHLVIVCGHYEGVVHRVHEHIANEVISIGDYVLSGGEIPAMVIVDSVVRLLPGVLGNPQS